MGGKKDRNSSSVHWQTNGYYHTYWNKPVTNGQILYNFTNSDRTVLGVVGNGKLVFNQYKVSDGIDEKVLEIVGGSGSIKMWMYLMP